MENDWSTYGDDKFLNSIDGISNDYVNNNYWGWFSNFDYGQTSLNKHLLTSNENLLIQIGRNPLKLEISTTTPSLNSTTTINVNEFGFVGWDGVWLPSASSTLFSSIGDQYNTNASGTVDVLISTTTPITFYATKNGFINSNSQIIQAVDNSPVGTTTITNSTGGSGGGSSQTHQTPDLEKMLSFLDANQGAIFSSDYYIDWGAVAYGSEPNHNSSTKNQIINSLQNNLFNGSVITDYERHSMAMMALGLNPYAKTNYIQKIIDLWNNKATNIDSADSGDIFGVITLMSSGYTTNDDIIKKMEYSIVSKQLSDGSWGNIDLTGAAIQALSLVQNVPGASQAISKGVNFLKTTQGTDGGFSNPDSTSWAIQGLIAGNSDPKQLVNDGNNPLDYLAANQIADGRSIGTTTDALDTRIWATEWAIPATAQVTWPEILQSVSKPTESFGSGLSSSDTSSTSTLATTTSTTTPPQLIQIATSTVSTSTIKKTLASISQTNKELTNKDNNLGTTTSTSTQNTNQLAGAAGSGFSFDTHKILMILGGVLAGIGVFSIIFI